MNYVKLTDLEHVLNSPDMYIGEIATKDKQAVVYNILDNSLTIDTVSYSSGLLKLFDEILINAVDNYQRNVGTNSIDIEINGDYFEIINNGKSIPIEKTECSTDDGKKLMYIPEMIFTQLRSGSNFKNQGIRELQTVGGKNGVGCKIVSIFSTKFIIDIHNSGIHYYQEILNNTREIKEPIIKKSIQEDKTRIVFYPDWKLLLTSENEFTENVRKMFYKRIYDISYLPLTINVDGIELPRVNWQDFTNNHNLHVNKLYHFETKDWKISFGLKKDDVRIKHLSFVNYISTYDGGTHVDYIMDQITSIISGPSVKKNIGESSSVKKNISGKTSVKSTSVTSTSVRSRVILFVSALINNPDFNSQAKEKLTTNKKEFNCILPTSLIKQFAKESDIVNIINGKLLMSSNRKLKKVNINTIAKVINAEKAGSRFGHLCTLFLCEGDSANTMCIRGISAMGKNGADFYGTFPLRGKPLNTRNIPFTKYLSNEEWNNVKTIIGLEDGKSYASVRGLNYGKIVCVKDADTDGASIMGLIINFFADKFPSLLKIDGFISEFVSPMLKMTFPVRYRRMINDETLASRCYVSKNQCILPFYNKREYESINFKIPSSRVKYIKGLGTNESSDIDHYFKNYIDNNLIIEFDDKTSEKLDLAFNSTRADDRKRWMEKITPDTYLPRLKATPIKCNDFIDNDLVIFSYDNCVRSIPSCIDGLKPTQRKILFTLLKHTKKKTSGKTSDGTSGRTLVDESTSGKKLVDGTDGRTLMKSTDGRTLVNDIDEDINDESLVKSTSGRTLVKFSCPEMKITELAGYVVKETNYHHGNVSVEDTIVKMAQDFPGANNIPLLQGIGQFGSRYQNGADAAQSRYLYTTLSPISRLIFPQEDDSLLDYIIEEGKSIEPRVYVPIIPMILVNGAEGIGTGWSTSIPCFNVKEIINVTKQLIHNERTIVENINAYYNGFTGKVEFIKDKWIIHGRYSIDKNEVIIEEIPIGKSALTIFDISEKLKALESDGVVLRWSAGDRLTPNFKITFSEEVTNDFVVKLFKLRTSIKNTNMVAFDSDDKINRYWSLDEIVRDWFYVRFELYEKRIDYIIKQLTDQHLELSEKCRFINEVVNGTIIINKRKKVDLVQELKSKKYVKIDNLLAMPIYSLTREKIDSLNKQMEIINSRLNYYKTVTVQQLWLNDIEELTNALH